MVDESLDAGADRLQIREKDLPAARLERLTSRALQRRRSALPVFVNGRADVALACRADGVHLPADGLPAADVKAAWGDLLQVGVSTHSLDEAIRAARAGADFITFGPVFDTPSKRRFGPPAGVERLEEVAARVDLPVLAIGGVNPGNAHLLRRAGAAGIAVISAVLGAERPSEAVAALRRAWG